MFFCVCCLLYRLPIFRDVSFPNKFPNHFIRKYSVMQFRIVNLCRMVSKLTQPKTQRISLFFNLVCPNFSPSGLKIVKMVQIYINQKIERFFLFFFDLVNFETVICTEHKKSSLDFQQYNKRKIELF